MTADVRCGHAPAVLVRRSLGSVLVRLPEGSLHTLTGTAAEVWEVLGDAPTAGEVASALAARYGAPDGDVLADVTTLLATLVDAGLVVTAPGRAGGDSLA